MTIHKYPIDIVDEQTIEIRTSEGSTYRIIHVGLDPSGQPCVWVELTPGGWIRKTVIHVVGTGGRVTRSGNHIGSFVHGPFVWHVYT